MEFSFRAVMQNKKIFEQQRLKKRLLSHSKTTRVSTIYFCEDDTYHKLPTYVKVLYSWVTPGCIIVRHNKSFLNHNYKERHQFLSTPLLSEEFFNKCHSVLFNKEACHFSPHAHHCSQPASLSCLH